MSGRLNGEQVVQNINHLQLNMTKRLSRIALEQAKLSNAQGYKTNTKADCASTLSKKKKMKMNEADDNSSHSSSTILELTAQHPPQ